MQIGSVTRKQVCLVTGGGRGIGAAIVETLAKTTAIDVVINYHASEISARQLLEKCNAIGAHPLMVQADVSSTSQVEEMFSFIEEKLGGVDYLVNNAGLDLRGLLTETSDEAYQRIMDVNLKGPFICCRRAIPHMIRQHSGKIINIASIWGVNGASYESVYAASKGGLITLTKSLAKELGPSGITVNAIAPGPIETEMLNAELSVDEKIALAEEIPLGRLGRPEEVAAACRFLLSNEAAYINGQVLILDGGWKV